jgi:dihydroxyacetone kinase phosphoprotein-dependent L subunit
MNALSLRQVELIVKTMADTAIENEQYFSELDGVMGDADFGVSLSGGFKAVLAAWDTFDHSTINSFLLNAARTLANNTGGSSGPVWGTLFRRFALAFKDKNEVIVEDIIAAFKSAIEGIMERGGAALGDKTLLDALDVIVKSLEASKGDELLMALKKAADAAVEAKETTKSWPARIGRASRAGDRTIDTYDPGIVAVGVMSQAIVKALSA